MVRTYEHLLRFGNSKKPEKMLALSEKDNFWTQDLEDAFSELLETLPGMAYRCENNRRWTMICISEHCRELTGYAPEEFLADAHVAFNDLIHPDDRQRAWDVVQKGVSQQQRFQLHYRIIHRDGHVRWVWEQGWGEFHADGQLAFLQGVIMEEKQKEKWQADAQNISFEHLSSKRVQTMAHDLGNLLSVINNYASAIQHLHQNETTISKHADRIIRTTKMAADLLTDLLDLEFHDTELVEWLSPADVLEGLEQTIRGLFADSVQIHIRNKAVDRRLSINRSQLERAIVNLAINSAQAIEDNQGHVVLEVVAVDIDEPLKCVHSWLKPGSYVCFRLADSGRGMNPDTILRIFEPYYSTRPQGHGMGMPMILSFARKSGGGIQVVSLPHEGTEFSLYFPSV